MRFISLEVLVIVVLTTLRSSFFLYVFLWNSSTVQYILYCTVQCTVARSRFYCSVLQLSFFNPQCFCYCVIISWLYLHGLCLSYYVFGFLTVFSVSVTVILYLIQFLYLSDWVYCSWLCLVFLLQRFFFSDSLFIFLTVFSVSVTVILYLRQSLYFSDCVVCICYRNSFSQTVPVFLCLFFVFLLLRFFTYLRQFLYFSDCVCVSVTEIPYLRQFLYFSACVLCFCNRDS